MVKGYTVPNGKRYRLYQYKTAFKLFKSRYVFYWRFSLDPYMFNTFPSKKIWKDTWSKEIFPKNFDNQGYSFHWLCWDCVISKEIK